MRAQTLFLALGCLLLVGCAGRDLNVMCDAAKEAQATPNISPADRATVFASLADQRLSRFGDARKLFQALAMVDPTQKYQLLKQGAAEMGHPEWDCPAIAAFFAPEPACPLWKNAKSVTVRAQSGRADFFREIRYQLDAGSMQVHDSDPSADGKEEKKEPRVTKKTITLAPSDQAKVERGLRAICPSQEQRAHACAPGGCMSLEVKSEAGVVRVEDVDVVKDAATILEPFFPELRRQ
jgi:hypothetical protein